MAGRRDDLRTDAWRTLRLAILERDGYICQECGKETQGADATVDHIIPAQITGTPNNSPSNLRTLCRSCNSAKGTSMLKRLAFIKPGWGISIQ
jgi:5-methylcytosine-specific restriction endonuclease McrA